MNRPVLALTRLRTIVDERARATGKKLGALSIRVVACHALDAPVARAVGLDAYSCHPRVRLLLTRGLATAMGEDEEMTDRAKGAIEVGYVLVVEEDRFLAEETSSLVEWQLRSLCFKERRDQRHDEFDARARMRTRVRRGRNELHTLPRKVCAEPLGRAIVHNGNARVIVVVWCHSGEPQRGGSSSSSGTKRGHE